MRGVRRGGRVLAHEILIKAVDEQSVQNDKTTKTGFYKKKNHILHSSENKIITKKVYAMVYSTICS